MRETLTFDDVLIEPQYSTVASRNDVDLSVSLSKGLKFKVPVLPANMKTVVNEWVAEEIGKLGGLCLLHRFGSWDYQVGMLKVLSGKLTGDKSPGWTSHIGVSIGVKDIDKEHLEWFIRCGVRIVCIDVAHGDHINCVEMVKFVSQRYPDVFLIAGNVATGMGAFHLWDAGADAVKVNVGAGSICSTRMVSGCGVPQFSALQQIYECRQLDRRGFGLNNLRDKFIIADGGCSKVGDLVKSLALSDLVMTGNLFAGSAEGPGERFELNGTTYAHYDGSSTHKTEFIEGVKAAVPAKGSIKDIVSEMCQGIASGCSYVGAYNLKELQEKAVFVKVSHASIKESGAHDVVVLG